MRSAIRLCSIGLGVALLPALAAAASASTAGPVHGHAATHHRQSQHRIPLAPLAPPSFYLYSAVFDGSGSYAETYRSPRTAVDAKASFRWHAVYPMIFISGGAGGGPDAGTGLTSPKASSFRGTWRARVTGDSSCSGSGRLVAQGTGSRAGSNLGHVNVAANPLVRGAFTLSFAPISSQPAQRPARANDCADLGGGGNDFWGDWPASAGVAQHRDLFAAVVALTPSREGKIVTRVKVDRDELPRKDCGTTADLGITCTVGYNWTGKITLTRRKLRR